MAVTKTTSNHYKYMLGTAKIDYTPSTGNTFKIILMGSGFVFDKDTHATLADLPTGTGAQIATNFGYTQNAKILSNVVLAEDDSSDSFTATWDDVTWEASGGNIGAFCAAIIYDDTTSDDTVVACIELGTDRTIIDGESYQFRNIVIVIA